MRTRPNPIDRIEIIEPPLEELTKRRSSFWATCLAGAGCLGLLIVLGFVGVRFLVGPGPSVIKVLPESFPKTIPIYDKENIERITLIPSRYKNRGLRIAGVIPKIILSPLLPKETNEGGVKQTSGPFSAIGSWLGQAAKDAENQHDTLQIEWTALTADPGFVISYYKNELRKQSFRITEETTGDELHQFSFTGAGDISGSLYVQITKGKSSGTDYMTLTVNVPAQKTK